MEFENEFMFCNIEFLNNFRDIKITGMIHNRLLYKNVLLIAPNSINRTASYSGTGLPFPCADIAFENSPNVYEVDTTGMIDIVFTYPNSYYTVANKKKIISSVFAVFESNDGTHKFIRLQLKDIYPLRTLVNRESRNGPEFYEIKHEILDVNTAELVLRQYAKIKTMYNIA
jgi:hypothetical protein